jgi:hypothetical protein
MADREVRDQPLEERACGPKRSMERCCFTRHYERLGEVGIDAAEEIEWVIRGALRRIERELQPILGYDSSWSNGSEVRDRILKVVDAIHYSTFIRNFVAAHKFGELVGELGPYDVFNVQAVARRLLLGCLGIWPPAETVRTLAILSLHAIGQSMSYAPSRELSA